MRDSGAKIQDARVPLWWLRALKGKENALSVLICLSAHVNRAHEAWPSAERIADLTGIRRDRVFAALRELRAAGLIETEHRHKRPSIHRLRFTVPANGPQDGASVVPFSGTQHDACSVPANGIQDSAPPHVDSSVPFGGTQDALRVPASGAMSTVQRCDEYSLHGPQTSNELDQEQRESARAHARENKNDDGDARTDVLRDAIQPLMTTALNDLATDDVLTLADYLVERFMDCDAPKVARQLIDMANDERFRRVPVHRLVYAARDAFNARGKHGSLWDFKVWLLGRRAS